MMQEARYYQAVKELAEAHTALEANKLLSQGWELLAIKETTRTVVSGERVETAVGIRYVLGRPE